MSNPLLKDELTHTCCTSLLPCLLTMRHSWYRLDQEYTPPPLSLSPINTRNHTKNMRKAQVFSSRNAPYVYWKWSQSHKEVISGVNIPLEVYVSSVVVTSCQRLGCTLLLKIARLTSRSMKFTFKMHKKRCGDEKNWNAIQILPHLNISNPEGLGENLKAWSTLEDFQKEFQNFRISSRV